MATSIYSPPARKLRNGKKKVRQEIVEVISAKYIADFFIELLFNTGEKKVVDFLPLFHRYVKGEYLKYLAIPNFKKFKVKNGNIYWGANEEVIFTIDQFYDFANSHEQEILYAIK